MNDVLVRLCDGNGDWEGRVNPLFARAIVAALSADPATLDDLDAALGRYVKRDPGHRLLGFLVPTTQVCPQASPQASPQDGDLLWVHLSGRVVAHRGDSLPKSLDGEVRYLTADDGDEVVLHYRAARAWQICPWDDEVPARGHERHLQRLANPPVDFRQTLYGQLPHFIADKVAGRELPLEPQAIRELHECWLMTPREDLGGATPRTFLVDQWEQIDHDISAREWEWATLGVCPSPLPENSQAWRYAGVGMHEFVLYYDLVRWLMGRVAEAPGEIASDTWALAEWLTQQRDAWFDRPDSQELHGRTPRDVIDHERRRIPWALSAEEAMVDHDCPLCRMMFEQGSSPCFCHLEFNSSAESFELSRYKYRGDWDMIESAALDFLSSRDSELGPSELEPPEMETPSPTATGKTANDRHAAPWRSSRFANDGIDQLPVATQLTVWQFRVLAQLMELREDVQHQADHKVVVDRMIGRVEDLRVAIKQRAEWLADTCLSEADSGVDDLLDRRPDLADKCRDIRRALQKLRQSCWTELPG